LPFQEISENNSPHLFNQVIDQVNMDGYFSNLVTRSQPAGVTQLMPIAPIRDQTIPGESFGIVQPAGIPRETTLNPSTTVVSNSNIDRLSNNTYDSTILANTENFHPDLKMDNYVTIPGSTRPISTSNPVSPVAESSPVRTIIQRSVPGNLVIEAKAVESANFNTPANEPAKAQWTKESRQPEATPDPVHELPTIILTPQERGRTGNKPKKNNQPRQMTDSFIRPVEQHVSPVTLMPGQQSHNHHLPLPKREAPRLTIGKIIVEISSPPVSPRPRVINRVVHAPVIVQPARSNRRSFGLGQL
jgi:hypothetical protein